MNYPGYLTLPMDPPSVLPEIQKLFNDIDRDKSGKLNAKELQLALVNGHGKNFSDTACLLMISMFDHDKSGTIDVYEFQQLHAYVNQWLDIFRTYDKSETRYIEEYSLGQALKGMGFNFSLEFINFLITKNDLQNLKQMSVDQFIVVCVQIQKCTEAFRKKDVSKTGVISLGFEEFVGMALNCLI